MSIVQKIILFFKDIFCGGCRETDNKEFSLFAPLLERKITHLKLLEKDPGDRFFAGVKQLLHIQAKFDFTHWSRSLENNPQYQAFTKGLEELRKTAIANVDAWENNPATRKGKIAKHAIRRWIEADPLQLKFAGYSNEIVFKAEEIPVGAVLLNCAPAYDVAGEIRGHRRTLMQRIYTLRDILCRFYTGLPLIHAVASLGGGKYLHVAKYNEETRKSIGCCSGVPLIEDYSTEKRVNLKKTAAKYMFGFEVVVPNYNRIGKVLKKSPDEVKKIIETEWRETLEKSQNHARTTFWNMVGTIFDSERPNNYDVTKVYNENPESGYSCSGLISVIFAKYGIDIVSQWNKRVDKASPADFVKTPLFDIAYSNDRAALMPHRQH